MAIKKKKKTARAESRGSTKRAPRPAPRATRAAAAVPVVELKKVAFTLFEVEEPARARQFYEEVLRLKRGLSSPDGTWTEYDLPAGGCLALFRHPDPSQRKKPSGSIAFEVSDLTALNRRLKKAGVTYHGDVVRGPRCRMSNISDSEGNVIILHQLDH